MFKITRSSVRAGMKKRVNPMPRFMLYATLACGLKARRCLSALNLVLTRGELDRAHRH